MSKTALPLLCAFSLFVSASAIGGDRDYTVRRGDTLSQIAAQELGRASAWRELQALNKVADPEHLMPGSVLRMPSAAVRRAAVFAEVVWTQGDARGIDGSGSKPLQRGAMLGMGDKVQTGPDGLVTLRFSDQSRLLISANSRVTLTRMAEDGKSGRGAARIALDAGAAESIVTPRQKVGAHYEVKTPALSLAVRGTRFRVAVDGAAETTRTTVSNGVVAAAAEGKTVVLTEGTGTMAVRGEAPSAPRTLLPAPVMAAPAATLEKLPVQFAWQPLADAGQYRVELLDRTGRIRFGEWFSDVASVAWADIPDGDYQLRVRGIDSAGLEGREAVHVFTLNARPKPPLLRLPVAGSRVDSETVSFRWARPQGAQRYRFQIASSATFENAETRLLQVSEDQEGIDLRLPRGRYFWRVAAAGAEGDFGANSDTQTFAMVSSGENVAVPLDSAGVVTLRWNAGFAGQRYRLQVALDPDFREPILDDGQAGNEAIFLQRGNGPYFVRILRIDDDGSFGAFEPAQQFMLAPVQ
ncbi:MAG TPA: FecR domain-containing protein [Gallionella sp.]|nr:FecR domain-containing protein [Gallionella sp.]